jgi:hypothetical protein
MTAPLTDRQKDIVALLCVGDAGGAGAMSVATVHGRPFIHHQIKSLEKLGIQRFFIGVDTVPGALLAYGDAVKKEGLHVEFVRNPQALAEKIDYNDLTLVIQSDTVASSEFVGGILIGHPLVATVEESPANQAFERIDLNNRWAGLAVLDRSSLSALLELPEGWDMASALLRQAVQQGVKFSPVRQSAIQSGSIRKIRHNDELANAVAALVPANADGPKTLEALLFSPLIGRVLPVTWSVSWGRDTANWLFPVAALSVAFMAGSGLGIAALLTAIVAIFATCWRGAVRRAEYLSGSYDVGGAMGWLLLSTALILLLYHFERSPLEAGFLGLTAVGLSCFASTYWKNKGFWISSPLVFAFALLVDLASDGTGWAARALIVVELGSLLLGQYRNLAKSPQNLDQA